MRLRLRVVGQVQGVGFRPFVARTAHALGLTGSVRNAADGVHVEVQGDAVEALIAALQGAPPPIVARVVERVELPDEVGEGFRIEPSEVGGNRLPTLPPDLATCAACLAELDDPDDRRHGYALLSCTACGPRYSIAGPPPFDRERSALVGFPHCPACRREYLDPSDRRFHAQASACAACGPRLSMSVDEAVAGLRGGGVLAVKGLAGFQLMCDATDEAAVARLRARKSRPDKPLAVMIPEPPPLPPGPEATAFGAPEAPIVLCELPLLLAPSVGRGVGEVGLMRPSTGVHHQLLQAFGGPLVCTSANLSGEPLATHAAAVGPLADAVLDHDRPIWRAADDSVVRVIAGRPRVLRRGRGHAPRPLPLGRSGPPLLAFGADLKSTLALGLDDLAILTPHLGSLGTRASVERFEAELRGLCEVYRVVPEVVVCDAHLDLVSSRLAAELAEARGLERVQVQHHHAHVAAVCAEHGLEGPVVGVAWDGVGAGPDGAVWGGEVLAVDGASMARLAHLHPLALPGGDACAREPGRTALALLHGAGLPCDPTLHPLAEALWGQLDALPATCSAVGRLFDGMAVLAGLREPVTYEAQLPILLEQAAATVEASPWPLGADPMDWRPWVHGLVRDRRDGVPLPVVARRLHETLVAALVCAVPPGARVVLAGGCFQNRLLAEGAQARLLAAGHEVWLAEAVPPGDGGLSLGQAWVARRRS